ncbi:hypothetical protein MANES_09G080700v8 [Manihot esculenta]|nr:hypothetical protein MANES_09G080700v8 [Manihot esculenta]
MKANVVSQNKLTPKSATDKTNVVSKGSQEQANQVSPQALKAGCKNGESTSFCKPPKIVGRVSPMLTSANKRASLGVNRVKMEKDSAKPSTDHSDNPKKFTVAGRGTKLPTMGGSRNTLPKSTLPSKSSLQSSVASKTELTTPSSSVDSLESLSSESSTTRSLNSVKRKTDSRTGNRSSTVSTVKSTLRTASRSKNQSVTSHISPYLKSVTKLSSSVSPSSSISEWSLESVSPTSTLNKRTNSSRPTLDIASCEDALDNGDAPRVFDSKNHSGERGSVGHDTHVIGLPSESGKRASIGAGALGHLDSIKPSRLRMPSPKIGFFDGARSTVRSPGGSMQSQPAVPNGLPRYRVRNVSLSGGSNEAKLGKSQPARAALAVRAAKTCAQQPVCSTSTNGKYCPGMPPKVQNKMSPGNSGQRNLKVEKITAEDCDTVNTILSQKVGEKEILGSLSNTSEKGLDLAQQVEAINIHREIQQKPVLDCSLHQVSTSGKVNV